MVLKLIMSRFIIRYIGQVGQSSKRVAMDALRAVDGLRIVDDSAENMLLVEGEEPRVREAVSHCAFMAVEPVRSSSRLRPVRVRGRTHK